VPYHAGDVIGAGVIQDGSIAYWNNVQDL